MCAFHTKPQKLYARQCVTKQCLGVYISFVTDVHLKLCDRRAPKFCNLPTYRCILTALRLVCFGKAAIVRPGAPPTGRHTKQIPLFSDAECNPSAHKLAHQTPEHGQHPGFH